MTTLSNQVNNGPVIFSLLKMIHTEVDEFGSTQSATKEDCQHCTITLASNLFDIWGVQERFIPRPERHSPSGVEVFTQAFARSCIGITFASGRCAANTREMFPCAQSGSLSQKALCDSSSGAM